MELRLEAGIAFCQKFSQSYILLRISGLNKFPHNEEFQEEKNCEIKQFALGVI